MGVGGWVGGGVAGRDERGGWHLVHEQAPVEIKFPFFTLRWEMSSSRAPKSSISGKSSSMKPPSWGGWGGGGGGGAMGRGAAGRRIFYYWFFLF